LDDKGVSTSDPLTPDSARAGREAETRLHGKQHPIARYCAWGMSEKNVEIVRRFNEPYEGKDAMPMIREAVAHLGPDPDPAVVLAWWANDPGWRYAHPEIEWDTTSITGFGSKVKGPAEVARWWIEWTEVWKSYAYRTVELRDLGDLVLLEAAIEARGPGDVPVAMTTFQLWEVRDGKVAACRVFMSEAEALKAAGVSE
jgi:hypothetical protein